MLHRKHEMDNLRAQMDEFVGIVIGRRAEHSAADVQVNQWARIVLVLIVALAGAVITLETRRVFHRLTTAYNRQIQQIKRAKRRAVCTRTMADYHNPQHLVTPSSPATPMATSNSMKTSVAQQLTGWNEAESKGKLHSTRSSQSSTKRREQSYENPVDKVRRLGTVVGLANHTFLVAKDGTEICIDDSGAPIRDSSGKMIGVVLVFRDITERLMSEGALDACRKAGCRLGRLAAFCRPRGQQPLEGLTNLVYIALRSDDLAEIRKLLTYAENELGRIAHIRRQSTRALSAISSSPAHFKPSAIVREVAGFYAARASNMGVAFTINAGTEEEVLGTAGELRQVLSNLLANSLDACSSGAVVRIEAKSAIDPRNPASRGVRITIADSGHWYIPSEHLESIFEPFFTTKKDTGTGLGLWVSRELIQKHGGSLRVRSRTTDPLCGTVFSLFLPKHGGIYAGQSISTNGVDSVTLNGNS